MGEIVYFTGGAKSGKSRLGQEYLINSKYQRVAYIATQANQFMDEELSRSIQKHQNSRPANWQTFEQFKDLADLIADSEWDFDGAIIDCATVWLTNTLFDYWQSQAQTENIDSWIEQISQKELENTEVFIFKELNALLDQIQKSSTCFCLISNEVGQGLVPENKLGRIFRNLQGLVNQRIAQEADQVYWVVSGISVCIKN